MSKPLEINTQSLEIIKFCGKDLPWLLLPQCWPCLGGEFSSLAFADPECIRPDISNLSYKTEGTLAQLRESNIINGLS